MLASNVHVEVVFQNFDPEWQEYVDLEKNTVLDQKEKLKMVITPIIVTPSPTGTSLPEVIQSCEDSVTNTPKGTRSVSPLQIEFEEHSDDESDFLQVKSLRRCSHYLNEESDSGGDSSLATSSVASEPKRKRRAMIKDADDSVPLPSPFPLPKHHSADVEVALRTKKMSTETTRRFVSSIAGTMLTYKRYPSQEDYRNVAQSVISRYPFLQSPFGSPHGAIVCMLQNRFKEFRREKSKRKATPSHVTNSESESRIKRCPPAITTIITPPSVPAGEDEISFKRHNKVLIKEKSKSHPNSQVVSDLMEITFSIRRDDIVTISCNITQLLTKYPFLSEENQVLREMCRILQVDKIDCGKWTKIIPKVHQ